VAFSDITERRRVETALKESQARYQQIVQTAAEGIWVLDARSRTTFVNATMARMLGYAPEELLGRSAEELLDEAEIPAFRQHLAERQSGVAARYERRYRRKDGGWVWASVSSQPVLDADGGFDGSFGMFTDITDRKAAEERQSRLEAQLRQSQKMEAVGTLSGGIAHDFNNLLTVITANASMLEEETALGADHRRLARDIVATADRAASLTRQLLAFSRRQTLQVTDFDLNTALISLTRMLERLVGEDVRMEVRPTREPARVHADRSMIEQVVLNLVVNARDAMVGQTTRHLIVEVECGSLTPPPGGPAPGPFVTLRVSDTGAGISADVLAHIFEPFFTTKEVGRGTGLGLAMVHGIVAQHGGWVSVESRVGEGASFDVHLPRIPEGSASGTASPEGAVAGGTETILIVEDEPQVRQVAVRSLTRLGYRTLEASTAAEALEVVAAYGDDLALVLTDIVMPGAMTGFELAARLGELKPALKILFSSGYSAGASGDVALEEGVNFISKPYSPSRLARAVRDRLDRSPTR